MTQDAATTTNAFPNPLSGEGSERGFGKAFVAVAASCVISTSFASAQECVDADSVSATDESYFNLPQEAQNSGVIEFENGGSGFWTSYPQGLSSGMAYNTTFSPLNSFLWADSGKDATSTNLEETLTFTFPVATSGFRIIATDFDGLDAESITNLSIEPDQISDNATMIDGAIYSTDENQDITLTFTPEEPTKQITLSLARPRASLGIAFQVFFTACENSCIACADGIDNDGNGAVDCEDEACQELIASGACEEDSSAECEDGFDNDCDGAIDCEDTGCFDTQATCHAIYADDDDYSASAVVPGERLGSILANDTVNDLPAIDEVDSLMGITILDDGGLTGLSVDAGGNFTVPASAEDGTYTFTYEICLSAHDEVCDDANVTLRVENNNDPCARSIAATDDSYFSLPAEAQPSGEIVFENGGVGSWASAPHGLSSGRAYNTTFSPHNSFLWADSGKDATSTNLEETITFTFPTPTSGFRIVATDFDGIDGESITNMSVQPDELSSNATIIDGSIYSTMENQDITLTFAPSEPTKEITLTLARPKATLGIAFQVFFTACENSCIACSDGIDNDGNGAVDCDDEACAELFATGACVENTEYFCQDGVDNDCNGLIDCEDAGCSESFTFCENIIANDKDYTETPVEAGTELGSILDNDLANDVLIDDISLISGITLIDNGGLEGLEINEDGFFIVPTSAVDGVYTFTYEICLASTPEICDQANVSIRVENLIVDIFPITQEEEKCSKKRKSKRSGKGRACKKSEEDSSEESTSSSKRRRGRSSKSLRSGRECR